jgi:uncharacterized protein YcbX
MERIGALETICRYPVKSMAGEELDEAFVGFAGMMGDRAYAFVRAPGPRAFPGTLGASRRISFSTGHATARLLAQRSRRTSSAPSAWHRG